LQKTHPPPTAEDPRVELVPAQHAAHALHAAARVVVGLAQIHDRVVSHRAQLTFGRRLPSRGEA
jgi:hypothetical protein